MRPSDYDLEELRDACYRGEIERVEHILKVHEDVAAFINYEGSDAFIVAITAGREAVCHLLISKGTDPNRVHGSSSPLEAAARNGHPGICELLLAAGAEIDMADSFGRRPLSQAAWNGHVAVVSVLCEHGANPNLSDSDGYPLHLAVSYAGFVADVEDKAGRIIELLVKFGSDIDCLCAGTSLLMDAAAEGNLKQCTFLRSLGANPLFADPSGKTALDYATENGHRDVVRFLTEGMTPPGISLSQGSGFNPPEYEFRFRLWTRFSEVSEYARRCAKGGELITIEVVEGGWIVPGCRDQENEEGFDPRQCEYGHGDDSESSAAEFAAAAENAEHEQTGPYMDGWLKNGEFD